MRTTGIFWLGSVGMLLLVAIVATILGWAPWSPRPAPPVQEVVSTPAAVPKPTAVVPPMPAPPRQAAQAATGATTTVASITRVTTTRWDYECRLDTLEKPECEWFLKETKTETKVGKPEVSVPYTAVVAAVVPTATVLATVQPTPAPTTPTVAPIATPAPTATPKPAIVAVPAPPAAPAPERQYGETGKGDRTQTWILTIPSGWVLIVGGYIVDGVLGGVYKAWDEGQKVTVTVTDGFYRIVPAAEGPGEFCTRLRQAREMGWAHSTAKPLPGWPAC